MRLACGIYGILALFGAGGCTSFDHENDGTSRRVLLGKEFTITMPASEEAVHPKIEDLRVACFLEHSQDAVGKNVYKFKATHAGETEIRIPRSDGSSEFVMTITVVVGGVPE